MKLSSGHLASVIITIMTLYSSQVLSHANFVPPGVDGKRQYPEGQRQFLRLNLAHDCGHGEVRNATIATVLVFPNGLDAVATVNGEMVNLVDYLYTSNPYAPGSSPYSAPAVFGIKPSIDADWSETIITKNETLPYYNHGLNTEDVSDIHWIGSYVPNEMVENLEFVANFPKFTRTQSDGAPNCVSSMRVYMPAIQYCTDGAINGWLLGDAVGLLAEAIDADTQGLVSNSETYAPYVEVLRNDPIDTSCANEEKLILYPSEAAVIEAQLEWNAKRAKKILKKAAIKRVRVH